MRIRRSVFASVLLLLVTVGIAQAYMPIALENVIKTWFNSAGKLIGFRIYESSAAPAVSGANDCRLYVDATTNSLMASCGTKAYTYLVNGTANVGCTTDVNGVQTCTGGYVSTDQGPATANAIRVLANATPQPCNAAGVWGQLTLTQTTPGGAYCFCNGQQLLSCISGTPVPTPTRTP